MIPARLQNQKIPWRVVRQKKEGQIPYNEIILAGAEF